MLMANTRQAYRAEVAQARRTYLRRLLGALAMLGFFAVLAVVFLRFIAPENMPIKRVLIEGDLKHQARGELMDAVASHARAGFFRVDLGRLEKSLEKLPWVAAASARRAWPDALLVRVREQVPIARWGTHALLNSRGEIFKPTGDLPEDLPLLFGPEGRERYLITQFHRASQLLKSAGLGLKALVEDERRSWYMVLDNGIPVALGRNQPEHKILRFSRIYPRTLTDRAELVAGVDMRYPNGFAVAWRPAPTGGGGAP
jgi:cell division protein FtsQ